MTQDYLPSLYDDHITDQEQLGQFRPNFTLSPVANNGISHASPSAALILSPSGLARESLHDWNSDQQFGSVSASLDPAELDSWGFTNNNDYDFSVSSGPFDNFTIESNALNNENASSSDVAASPASSAKRLQEMKVSTARTPEMLGTDCCAQQAFAPTEVDVGDLGPDTALVHPTAHQSRRPARSGTRQVRDCNCSARRSLQQSSPVSEPSPTSTTKNESGHEYPYTEDQLKASDADAEEHFTPLVNKDQNPSAFLKAMRKKFPFYKTDISIRDRRAGFYTFDEHGHPAFHNRIHKENGDERVKVNHKRKIDDSCCAANWYDDWKYKPKPWGPSCKDGSRLFNYLDDAQLKYCIYTTKQIKYYLEKCPRQYTLHVQREPTQCNHRRAHANGKDAVEDKRCRWANCPIGGRPVTGFYRVAFDEFAAQTALGIKDPYKVAMVMHLWCFEQIVDPVEYYEKGVLLVDSRTFAGAEVKNNFSFRSGQKAICNAFNTWFEKSPATHRFPRPHEQSLGHKLTSCHDRSQGQSKANQRERRKREKELKKGDGVIKSMDWHLGNLDAFAKQGQGGKIEEVAEAGEKNSDSQPKEPGAGEGAREDASLSKSKPVAEEKTAAEKRAETHAGQEWEINASEETSCDFDIFDMEFPGQEFLFPSTSGVCEEQASVFAGSTASAAGEASGAASRTKRVRDESDGDEDNPEGGTCPKRRKG
ncbi:hypothetical protein C2857_006564 [Epichloe festucae Fl1]|uniref:Uncharacterized protein n=1 Tax=Epichloe festucae (strain Fl1) TaxID=877507 RepID=A0A7S9PWB0_EPIFF|nr:hypothetical protein C2857_006564 [Epichloe festucae Fl1]